MFLASYSMLKHDQAGMKALMFVCLGCGEQFENADENFRKMTMWKQQGTGTLQA
jgi:hypothetical protein